MINAKTETAMTKGMIMSLGRAALVTVLILVAMVLLFCEPSEVSEHWLRDLLLTKCGAAAAIWWLSRIVKSY